MVKGYDPCKILDGYGIYNFVEEYKNIMLTKEHAEAHQVFIADCEILKGIKGVKKDLQDRLDIANARWLEYMKYHPQYDYSGNETNPYKDGTHFRVRYLGSIEEEYNRAMPKLLADLEDYSYITEGGYELYAGEPAKNIILMLEKLYDIKPMTHKYMLNISPNWKTKVITLEMIDLLEDTIIEYLREGDRWSYASYTLETGGEGTNLHAHIVATPNPKRIKSVDTHVAKGTHSQQLQKCWNKKCSSKRTERFRGALKGKFAVQRIVCRTEEIINDKYDYLVEELKPEGHRNKKLDRYPELNKRNEWKGTVITAKVVPPVARNMFSKH